MKGYLSAVGAVIVGLGASQLPAFDQQYTQRLGGAVDELRIITERFEASAQDAGLSREAALTRFAASGDGFLTRQGEDMETIIARYERLSAHLASVQTANPIERTLDLTRFYDAEIGARTLETFEPALPVSAEGLGFLGAGLVAGYLFFWLALTGIVALFRRSRPSYGSTRRRI